MLTNSTRLWVIVQKRKNDLLCIIIAILSAIAGYVIGLRVSPYYASAPIVFQHASEDQTIGSIEGLQAIKNEGIAMRPTPKLAVSSTPAPQVAGATNENAGQGQFVASKNSTLFHHISCSSAKQIKLENQRWFATADEAKSAGLSPSKCTQEILGE